MIDQGPPLLKKESGEPSLRPEDYDFAVAGMAKALKDRLYRAEGVWGPLQNKVRDSIYYSALGSEEANKDSYGDAYKLGFEDQPALVAARSEVDAAFKVARKHYRENQDQYVENAAQEYRVVQEVQEF